MLQFAIVGQLLMVVSTVGIVISSLRATRFSLSLLMLSLASHSGAVICLVVTIMSPFKELISERLMNLFLLVMKLAIYFVLPFTTIGFYIVMWSSIGEEDSKEYNTFTLIFLGIDTLQCVGWCIFVMISLQQVKIGIRVATAEDSFASPQFLQEMNQ